MVIENSSNVHLLNFILPCNEKSQNKKLFYQPPLTSYISNNLTLKGLHPTKYLLIDLNNLVKGLTSPQMPTQPASGMSLILYDNFITLPRIDY